MKLGQLMEYNMKNNIFAEKSYTQCAREIIPRLSSKNIKIEHISGLKM